MYLSKHDLLQMDDEWLKKLPADRLLEVSRRLLHDVKTLQDRLNQTPTNSSRPPGSQAPWDGRKGDGAGEAEWEGQAESAEAQAGSEETEARRAAPAAKEADPRPAEQAPQGSGAGSKRRPGRQPGSPGHGRTQKLAVTHTCEHHPETCAACGAALPADAGGQAYTAWDEIDLAPLSEGEIGLRLSVTRHLLFEERCGCGHVSRAQPWRAPADGLWEKVDLGQWRLVGPRLAAMIVLLALRMRLSRARIRELLLEWFDLSLSTGLIDQTLREAGRASEPLEDALVADIQQAAQLHIDETPWPQSGVLQWLWVLASAHTVLYLIGPRSREMLENVLEDCFTGILVSDGYGVYRAWDNRLRCWAHLMRKLRGLAESSDSRVARVGREMEGILKTLMTAIYEARGDPQAEPPTRRHRADIERLRHLCESHRDDAHERLRHVAREFLYDWEVILRPVAEPQLALTNNAAEQALRHWVIARRISHGTRSDAGSRAYALLASVIETCRCRGVSAWRFLGSVLTAARQGLPLPAIPAVVGV